MEEFSRPAEAAEVLDNAHSMPAGESPTESVETPDSADMFAGRLDWIRAHRLDAHRAPSTLSAVLRGVNSDLMEFELHAAERLRQILTTESFPDDGGPQASLLKLVIKLTQQIGQISQLELRLRQGDSNNPQPSRVNSKK